MAAQTDSLRRELARKNTRRSMTTDALYYAYAYRR
jgi:hypothetical protein